MPVPVNDERKKQSRAEASLKRALALMALVFFLPLASCGDDDDYLESGALGAWCRDNRDCPERCEEGFCTFSCASDAHCPGDYACADPHGGVCMALCAPSGCAPGYSCRSTKRRGAGGDVFVCRR